MVDTRGDLYIADQLNHRIRKVTNIAALTPGGFDPLPDTVAADTTPPMLLDFLPGNGAFVHPDSAAVVLTFSEPIDTAGATLRAEANGRSEKWRAVLEADLSVLAFTPVPELTYDTEYRMHLSGIADTSGNVAGDIVIGFATMFAPADTIFGEIDTTTVTVPPDTTTIVPAESLISIDFDPSLGDQERRLTSLSGGGQSIEVQLNIRDAPLISGWGATIEYEPGFYQIQWDGNNDRGMSVSSGMYLARLQVGDFVEVGKLLLVQ